MMLPQNEVKCSYCKKKLIASCEQVVPDGYDMDNMNSKITLEKLKGE